MNEKFDPVPFDKYAADPKKAIEIDRIVDQQLQAGIVGGSFPASDPISATQPSPSIYDEGNEPRNERRKHCRPEDMTVMDYCGVEFTAIELEGGSLWKWQLLILNDDKMKSCGEAASREAAISQAHEAIGDGLRANAGPSDDALLSEVVGDVLHVLHGARGLPSSETVEALQPFLSTMRSRASGIDVLADASADAVGKLVQRLEATGIATDDLWEEAIEASLSFANETGFGARPVLEG
jgi:hypothetical protein